MKVSILDYLGKVGDGILVLVSFVYLDKYYEGMFFYTNEKISLTVEDSLENIIGSKIEDYVEYVDILKFLLKGVVPWSEMISRIDEIDSSVFSQITEENVRLAGDVNPNDILIAKTQSII